MATPPLLPTLTVSSREVPLLGFRLMWRSSVTVALAMIAATIPALIFLLAFCSAAVVAAFSPVSRFSRYFGVFCSS